MKLFAFWSPASTTGLPGSFSVADISPISNGFDVTWTASSGADSYTIKVYLNDLVTLVATFSGINALTYQAYNDTTFVNGSQYYVVVSAVNSGGSTQWLSGFQFVQPSPIPGGFDSTSITPTLTGCTLRWSYAEGAEYYIAEIYDSPSGTLLVTTDNVTSNQVEVFTLTQGVTYYALVTAYNAAGSQEWSDGFAPFTVVSSPLAFSSTSLSPDDRGFSTSWTASTFATSYEVQIYSASLIMISSYVVTGSLSKDVVGDASITNGSQCYMKVVAKNSAGSTEWSDGFAPFTPTTLPIPAPFSLLSLAPRWKGFTVSWTPSSNLDEYVIRVYSSDATTVVATYSGISGTSYFVEDDSALTNGSLHYISVSAVNGFGERHWNEGKPSFTPLAGNIPGSFDMVAIVPRDKGFYTSWSPAADSLTYTVQVYTSVNVFVKEFTGITGTAFDIESDAAISNGSTYHIKVVAVNNSGTSYWTGQYQSVAPTNLLAPATFDMVSLKPRYMGFDVVWNPSAFADSFNINVFSQSGGPLVKTYVADGSTTEWDVISDSSFTNNTRYEIEVEAVNTTGTTEWSNGRSGFTPAIPIPSPFVSVSVTSKNKGFEASWTKSEDADAYSLQVFSASNMTGLVQTLSTTSQSYSVTNVSSISNNIPYYLMVEATNSFSQSAFWDGKVTVPFTPALPTTPGVFTEIDVTPLNQGFNLSWTPSSNAQSYSIHLLSSTTMGTQIKVYADITTTSLSNYDPAYLVNSTSYYLRAEAINDSVSNWWSSGYVNVTPKAFPETFSLSSISASDGGFNASWSLSNFATSYTVEIYATDNSLIDSYSTASTSTSYTSALLVNFVTYFLKVTATNIHGSKVWSDAGVPFVPVPPPRYGCTNPLATNYDPTANIDDGSCIYP